MTRKDLEEVVRSLIYHGRHFSPKRDMIVTKKSIDYIIKLMKEHKKK